MQQELAAEMERAAEALEFERAAAVRDRIRALTFVQGSDVVNPASLTDADVIAAWQTAGQTCVQVFFVRGGRNNGNRAFFPTHAKAEEAPEVLGAFIAQFYDDKPPPPLRAGQPPAGRAGAGRRGAGAEGGAQGGGPVCRSAARSTPWCSTPRPTRARRWSASWRNPPARRSCWRAWRQLFGLPAPPERIEVYDNSHIMGANPYGVMIVAGPEGFVKAAYRKFGIRGPIAPGDDFAMMREVLQRRFARALKEQAEGAPAADWPDLVLIDGGAGQLSAARGRAGRPGRAGREAGGDRQRAGPRRRARVVPHRRRWNRSNCRRAIRCCISCSGCATRRTGSPSPRTAPGGRRRSGCSELDEIPGIGAARKRALLNHFGSARGVKMAGLADLEAAPGISRETARLVYAHFHPGVRMEAGG